MASLFLRILGIVHFSGVHPKIGPQAGLVHYDGQNPAPIDNPMSFTAAGGSVSQLFAAKAAGK